MPGSGKSTLGTTVHLNGDYLRSILKLVGYSFKNWFSNSKKYTGLAKYLMEQGFNIVFSLVGLMNKPR